MLAIFFNLARWGEVGAQRRVRVHHRRNPREANLRLVANR